MFNFQEELEEQLQELIEKYGEDHATKYWIDDYYDGEYCNPPVYRWSRSGCSGWVTVIKLSTRGWYGSGPWYYKV